MRVRLDICSGKQAGVHVVARRFPVRIGRAAAGELCSEEAGVWERHLEIQFRAAEGFQLVALPEAPVRVNGQPVTEARLRNGDLIEAGSLKLRFWLAQTQQSTMRLREALIWAGLVAITLGQVALIYRLLE